MKKVFVAVLLCSVLMLSGCITIETETTNPVSVEENTTTLIVYQTEYNDNSLHTEAAETESEVVSDVLTEETTALPEESTTEDNAAEEPSGDISEITEVDLSIEMPEKNGTMQTSSDENNKYIKAVSSDRDIEKDKLVAVFAVPESGQNYVFEFYDGDNKAKSNLRRVYLLDAKCRITGVAAADVSEKEGISSVENWFCMNVLIKEVIFPAIEDSFR